MENLDIYYKNKVYLYTLNSLFLNLDIIQLIKKKYNKWLFYNAVFNLKSTIKPNKKKSIFYVVLNDNNVSYRNVIGYPI